MPPKNVRASEADRIEKVDDGKGPRPVPPASSLLGVPPFEWPSPAGVGDTKVEAPAPEVTESHAVADQSKESRTLSKSSSWRSSVIISSIEPPP